MEKQRFWIVGGEYRSLEFDAMIAGTEKVVGPLAARAQAEVKWREMSEHHRDSATVRFAIASEYLPSS
jgi:hypothetical protein